MNRINIIFFVLGLLFWSGYESYAQSRSFRVNQYMFYQPSINPAAQASYSGLNAIFFHRSQWIGLEGAPQTTGFQVSLPWKKKPVTIGASVYKDKIGAHSRIEAGIPITYELKLDQKSRLAFGLTYFYNNLRSDLSDLNVTHTSDPTLGDVLDIDFFNFRTGAYYYRDNFYAGIAINDLAKHAFAKSPAVDYFTNNGGNTYLVHLGGALHDISKTRDKKNLFSNLRVKHRLWASTLVRYSPNQPVNAIFNLMYELKQSFGFGISYSTSNEFQGLFRMPLSEFLQLGYSYQYTNADIPFSSTHEVMLILDQSSLSRLKKKELIIPRF